MASLAKLRTRWAAIGAACAVTLGGSTLGIVQASVSSGDRAVYVPITPVRVLDTRSDVGVATVQDATPALLTVTGTIATTSGQQNVVPVGASSVVINVTAINPTSDGFVSLRPGDATGAPAVSTLNVTVGGTFPNGATITLPTSGGSAGQVQIWYEAYAATGGTTDLLIDVVGYYTNHNHDDRYYTETEVDTALAGKADASELASKANTSDVNTAIAGKANTSDLTSGLASKASVSDLTSGLADKADITSLMAPITPSVPATIDSAGGVGLYSAITIGTNGNPIISYHDETNLNLKVAACNNPTCTTSTNNTIADVTGGLHTSIAIGIDGNPIISYFTLSGGDLEVAACDNPTCTTSTNTIIDSDGIVGSYTSIAIGANGNPIISYYDQDNGDLKVATCEDLKCLTAINTTIDGNGNVGKFTSIAIGTNGNPIISYYDQGNGDLKVAACKNPTCTGSPAADNYTIDSTSNVGLYPSIAIGIDGNPIISYLDYDNQDLKVAACSDPTCTTSTKSTINSAGFVTVNSSIAIGTNGNPIISYSEFAVTNFDFTNLNLKVAICKNPTCNGLTASDRSTSTIIDSGGAGIYNSIAIGTNGNPIISYWDITNSNLKVFSPWWLTGGR
jgi:hypothetical protein